MKRIDEIFVSLAFALSVTLMAGVLGTGVYANAAASEAVGYSALLHAMASKGAQQ